MQRGLTMSQGLVEVGVTQSSGQKVLEPANSNLRTHKIGSVPFGNIEIDGQIGSIPRPSPVGSMAPTGCGLPAQSHPGLPHPLGR